MGRGQGSWAIAPQCRMTPFPPPDLSASVNGEATSQKGGSTEDKEQEEGQNLEEGPVGGSSEDLLHNDSAREGPDLDGPGKDRQERQRAHVDSESLDDEDS
ncbi:Hepatoma-derived growth factor-related protein 2 [Myotis davidii]|uniref:Hepatoma-derived growth factor-related protein 2 n=1 Tax=Myotis davidii TaxID=225400 RepID=L5MGK5_MYODS|nr:Hepatoma-derived growth factor-related protein 2 [Myotis davidii]